MILCFAGCGKANTANTDEWLTEKKYYAFENGEWVEIQDPSIFETMNDSNNDDVTQSGPVVDSSAYQTIVDYCNDEFKLVYEHDGMQIEYQKAEILEDDARFIKRSSQKDGYVTYKVDGIAEFFVEYTYGPTRDSNNIRFYVSPDNENWTEVKPQDELYLPVKACDWIRTRAYFGDIDPSNQYLKIHVDSVGEALFLPNINMVQINGLNEKALSDIGMFNSRMSPKTVYIDSANGNDKNDGLTEKTALKSLYAASKKLYAPGSKILLKSGCEFAGSLKVIGTGTKGNTLTISSYGKGAKPVINARGGSAVEVYGEYITITGIKITNKNGEKGIEISSNKNGATRNINITKCDFEDINVNFTNVAHSSAAIHLSNLSRLPSWYDGINISENTFKRVARCGITISNNWGSKDTTQEFGNLNDAKSGEWYGHKNVVIRNNTLEQTGGDGILIFGCKAALVEGNVVGNSALLKNRGEQHFVPIWCHSSENCLFQYNEVFGTRSTNNAQDLQAFDCDIGNKDCIFQYNYSHDNEGGFMLICSRDEALHPGSKTTGTIVRYNLSVNDGKEEGGIFVIDNSVYDSHIYNNTVYAGKYNLELVKFVHYDKEGTDYSKNTVFTNNIFYGDNEKNLLFGYTGDEKLVSASFNNNVFYGIDTSGITNDKIDINGVYSEKPNLVQPGYEANGLKEVAEKYKPVSGFVLEKGIEVSGRLNKDLFGNEINGKLLGAFAK